MSLGRHLAGDRAEEVSMRARKPVPFSAARTPVIRVMTAEAITARPDLSLDTARDLLLGNGLSRVPVVDEGGRPIGMLSLADLVVEEHDRGGEVQEVRERVPGGFHVHEEEKSISDVMTRKVVSVPESASVAQAAEILVSHRLHGAPVISAAGVVVGFVSASDVLAWLAGLR
jgi:CBS domain-containing protein